MFTKNALMNEANIKSYQGYDITNRTSNKYLWLKTGYVNSSLEICAIVTHEVLKDTNL